MIRIKRAYEEAEKQDGKRYLVDRYWPRGVKKTELHVDEWIRKVAPSPALCQWFGHEPEKWRDFQRRYFSELQKNSEAWQRLLDEARRGTVTLVFSARDAEHNNAVALKEFLEAKL